MKHDTNFTPMILPGPLPVARGKGLSSDPGVPETFKGHGGVAMKKEIGKKIYLRCVIFENQFILEDKCELRNDFERYKDNRYCKFCPEYLNVWKRIIEEAKSKRKIFLGPEEFEELYGDGFSCDENRYMYHAFEVFGKCLVDFQDDPVGFRSHRLFKDIQELIEPFIGYCRESLKLIEAHKIFIGILNNLCLNFAIYRGHKTDTETTFQIETGRKLDDVKRELVSSDKRISQDAAILITRIFKDERRDNPLILGLIEQAIKSDDLDFLKRLDLAEREIWINKEKKLTFRGRMKRPEMFLLIRQLGEDFVKTLSHNELLNICRKKGINITGMALKEFLLYHSVKKERPWRPVKKREEKLDGEELKLLESKKRDFRFYLWGSGGAERFFKHMEKLKDKMLL